MTEVNKKDYKYKFSVVIPVYNVEKYIEETLLSIVNQTIGFEENVQIILVNDGSTDNSEEICLKYREKYNNNIIYVKQENSGVSAARNNGMKHIEGKYVSFIDADDKWNDNVFERVYDFFEKYYDEIDMISCRIRLFGQREGFNHPLDYKFRKNMIVDIREDYTKIQMSAASSIFKAEAIKNRKFDEGLKFAEDAKFIAQLLPEKEKYGVLRNCIYNYRKREEGTSAIQTSLERKEWYNDTVERCYENIIDDIKNRYGKIPPYFQYQIMYDFQWRLSEKYEGLLSPEEEKRYIDSIKYVLRQIDDYIICEQRKITVEKKLYALSLKYDRDIKKELEYRNKKIFFNNIQLSKLYNNHLMIIKLLDIKDNALFLEGEINCVLPKEDYQVYFEDDFGKRYDIEYYDIHYKAMIGVERVVFEPRGFRIKIPLKDLQKIRAVISIRNENFMKIKLRLDENAKLNLKYKRSYYCKNGYIITSSKNNINVFKESNLKHLKLEVAYDWQLLKEKKIKEIFYRILYYLTKPFIKRPIWIVSDRSNVANDNGYHMFKYLVEHEKNAKVYFMISKKSRDYKKLKKIGKVLEINSLKYKMLFLHSDKIISSQADEFTTNAFGPSWEELRDLYNFDYVFLQHGIIKSDLSAWLHKQNKNIKLLITSAKREYESVINGDYGYTKEQVKLTGLPRHDNLHAGEKSEKEVIIMPTWRKFNAGEVDKKLGTRKYSEKFKNTDYYEFYNNLINDKRILDVLKEKGYTGKFFVHPSHIIQAKDFKGNDIISVQTEIADYQKEFKKASLMVTDYSSVAFDFSYMKKPVVYTQFDIDKFFAKHISSSRGYFEEGKDGFGEVCYNYEDSVNAIIKNIKNDCKLDKKYEERINNFYYKFDNKNCERVHNEILKLK